MATMRTAMQMTAGMSQMLRAVNQSVNKTIRCFESLQSVVRTAMDSDNIQRVRVDVTGTTAAFNELGDGIGQAKEAQRLLNEEIQNGRNAAESLLQKFAQAGTVLGAMAGMKRAINSSDPMLQTGASPFMSHSLPTMEPAATALDTQMKEALANNAELAVFVGQMNTIVDMAGELRSNVQNIAGFLEKIAGINVSKPFSEIAGAAAGFAADHWQIIEPVIWGVVGAVAAYNLVAQITNGILAGQAFMKGIATLASKAHEAALKMEAGATFLAMVEQYGLNAALLACPITWIILGIIALVAILYAVVAAVNQFAGTSISATGIIAGVFAALGSILYNIIAYIWNGWAAFIEFFANVFTEPVYSVQRLFFNLANNVLTLLSRIAEAMDKVFGSNLVGSVTSLQGKMKSRIGEMPESYKTVPRMEMRSVVDDFSVGYDWGKGMADKFNLDAIIGGEGLNNDNLPENIAATAVNTAAMKNSMEVGEEDLKYMRDLAEQEVINRFTTAEIKVDMVNNNTINSSMDMDGVVTYLTEKVQETMEIAAEGVHS